MKTAVGIYYFFAIYTQIPLKFLSVSVPMGVAFLAAPLLFLSSRGKFNRDQVMSLLNIIFVIILLASLQYFEGNPIAEYLDSSLLLIGSIGLGFLFYNAIRDVERQRLSETIFKILLVLLLGITLESLNVGFVSELSNAFRLYFFEGHMYTSDLRDIHLHGGVRPKFFTSEPSHVAKYLCVLIVSWWLVTDKINKNIVALVFSIVGVVALRSPQMLAIPIAFLVIYLCLPGISLKSRLLRIGVTLLLLAAVSWVTFILVFEFLPTRLVSILAGDDASLMQRLFAPLILAGATFVESPWVGFGAGASSSLDQVIQTHLGALVNANTSIDDLRSVASVFFAHWISFGLVGGLVLGFAYFRLLGKIIGAHGQILAVALISLFALQQGGYNGTRFWCFFFLVAAVIQKADFNTPHKSHGLPHV